MAYDSRQPNVLQVGAGAAFTLSSTGVFAYTWNFLEPSVIRQIAVKVTTIISSSAPVVVQFLLRPTYGSTSGQTVLGTVTLTGTQAANTLVVNNIKPVSVPANSQIVANCSTAATSSGAGVALMASEYSPEESLNESVVLVTA